MSIMSGLPYHQQKSESTRQPIRAALRKIVILFWEENSHSVLGTYSLLIPGVSFRSAFRLL